MNIEKDIKDCLIGNMIGIANLEEVDWVIINKYNRALVSCFKKALNEEMAEKYLKRLKNIKYDSISHDEPIINIEGVFERGKKELENLVNDAIKEIEQ